MGRIVINETENKQTLILNDTPEGVYGGYFDSTMNWHDFEGGGAVRLDLNRNMSLGSVTKYSTQALLNKVTNYEATNRIRIPLPIENPGKISLVDPVIYDLIGFSVESLSFTIAREGTTSNYLLAFQGYESEASEWKKEIELSGPYIWFAIRKSDNSDFTEADLANPLNRLYRVG